MHWKASGGSVGRGMCSYDIIHDEDITIPGYKGTCGSREPCFYWDNNQPGCGTIQMGDIVAKYVVSWWEHKKTWRLSQKEGKAIGIYSRCVIGINANEGAIHNGSRYHSNLNFMIGRKDDIDEIKNGLCIISSAEWSIYVGKARGITYKQATDRGILGSHIGSR